MVNPNLLKMAQRLGNDSLPVIEKQKPTPTATTMPFGGIVYPDLPKESFIFSYDGPHGDFFQELIGKVNETFSGTTVEIPVGTSGEVKNMYMARRMALVSTIASNPNLVRYNLFPIAPMQSEGLLHANRLTTPKDNWEDLALLLYDKSSGGIL